MRASCSVFGSVAMMYVMYASCRSTEVVSAPGPPDGDSVHHPEAKSDSVDDVFVLPGPEQCRVATDAWCAYLREHCGATSTFDCFVPVYEACIEANRGVPDIDDCTVGICLTSMGVYSCVLPGEQCYFMTRRYDPARWVDVCGS